MTEVIISDKLQRMMKRWKLRDGTPISKEIETCRSCEKRTLKVYCLKTSYGYLCDKCSDD